MGSRLPSTTNPRSSLGGRNGWWIVLAIAGMAMALFLGGRHSRKVPAHSSTVPTASQVPSAEPPELEPGPGSAPKFLGFDLEHPERRLRLPNRLKEISGVAAISEDEIAAIQDEAGIVYLVDLKKGKIKKEIEFAKKGDYEEILLVDAKPVVIRSDGLAFRLDSLDEHHHVSKLDLGLEGLEIEAVAYDPASHRLLIAPKSYMKHDEDRRIYGYDLRRRALQPEPAISFGLDSLYGYISDEQSSSSKGKVYGRRLLRILPSGMAIQPKTGLICLVSSFDHTILALDPRGKIVAFSELEPQLFPQPEGITFLPSGALVISNEGGGGKGTILIFSP